MKNVAKAVVEAGLVDASILKELNRWGVMVDAKPKESILSDAESVVDHIRKAIESEDHVRLDETELDLIRRYLDKKKQREGRLVLKDGKKHTTLNVTFCMTVFGECALPWSDEDTPDLLTNGETHLRWRDGDKERDMYFTSAREVFFGTRKAFVVCEVSDGK